MVSINDVEESVRFVLALSNWWFNERF
jgi:hypothetical protein